MALLQFKCEKCGKNFEELTKADAEAPKCPLCGASARRAYEGKVYAGKKKGGSCSGNCSTCGGCH